MNKQLSEDARLIEFLGGPAKLAELLGFPKEIGIQRVHNWKSRGIPARVRLSRRDLFDSPEVFHSNPAKAEA